MIYKKTDGAWSAANPSAKIAGVWKPCEKVFSKVDGVWKQTYQRVYAPTDIQNIEFRFARKVNWADGDTYTINNDQHKIDIRLTVAFGSVGSGPVSMIQADIYLNMKNGQTIKLNGISQAQHARIVEMLGGQDLIVNQSSGYSNMVGYTYYYWAVFNLVDEVSSNYTTHFAKYTYAPKEFGVGGAVNTGGNINVWAKITSATLGGTSLPILFTSVL